MLNRQAFSTLTQNKFWILASSISLALLLGALFFVVPTFFSYQVVLEPKTPTLEVTQEPEVAVEPPPPIFFTGDMMLGRYVENLLGRGLVRPYDFISLFASSSAVVVNFESAIAVPHIVTPSGGMRFSTATTSLAILRELSVTHASLANNHARDYGPTGYQNALRELANRTIVPFGDAATVGTSSLTYLLHGEETIGLIGIHTLFVTPTIDELETMVAVLSASSTVQIAYVHWGNEYELTHSKTQAAFAEMLIAAGVDIIIGHHPHVTQDITIIDGVPVFYSLGNFIFDQYFSPDVEQGLVLGLTIEPTSYTFELYPHYQCARSTPCLMEASQQSNFLDSLASRSSESLQRQIRAQKLVIPR